MDHPYKKELFYKIQSMRFKQHARRINTHTHARTHTHTPAHTHTHTRLTEAAGELPFLAEAFRLGAPDGDASKGVLRRAALGAPMVDDKNSALP